MQVEGKLVKKIPFEQQKKKDGELICRKNGDPFLKGGMVVLQKGEYPKEVCLEFFREDVASFVSDTTIDTEVIADVNIESREWQGRYFTSASCWRVNKSEESASTSNTSDDTDDLPF